jgi:hypothetical protein
VGFFASFFPRLCHLYYILHSPIDQPSLEGEDAVVGLSAEDKPALSPSMSVLHALNLSFGYFPGTFSQSGREKKNRGPFTATFIRRSACHLFQHDIVFGLTERDKCVLTSLYIQRSVFGNVTQYHFKWTHPKSNQALELTNW